MTPYASLTNFLMGKISTLHTSSNRVYPINNRAEIISAFSLISAFFHSPPPPYIPAATMATEFSAYFFLLANLISETTIVCFQHEAVTNLQKAKANYIKCQQDRDKARDATQKADTDNQSQGTAAQAKKLDNKRKLEEEAIYKV